VYDLIAIPVPENILDIAALAAHDLLQLPAGIVGQPTAQLGTAPGTDPDAGAPLKLPLYAGNSRREETSPVLPENLAGAFIHDYLSPRAEGIGDPVLAAVEALA